ncbi:AmmeMemoRadiSam system protein B [Candidatus Fermentibacterales bacterium]|nr:AmmeMemoRadiSam system protein B [Candidatus Fermentibacterales bacterium]
MIRRIVPVAVAGVLAGCGSTQASGQGAPGADTGYVRPAAVAGSFYPADSAELSMVVSLLLDEAGEQLPSSEGRVVSGVAPHAGYVYSGRTAARLYALLEAADSLPEVVVLLSAAHSVGFDGLSVFGGAAYATPLGDMPVDPGMSRRIRQAHPAARYERAFHEREHTIEVHIPFLQLIAGGGDMRVLPILLGRCDPDDLRFLAELLAAEAAETRVVVIASSDLAHYPERRLCDELDSTTVEAFMAGDPESFLEVVTEQERAGHEGVATCACGSTAMYVVLCYDALMGLTTPLLLGHATSADGGGDPGAVVGYAAIAVVLPEGREASGLTDDEKSYLCSVVSEELHRAAAGLPSGTPELPTGRLLLPSGVFVTYRESGALRGCIGSIRPVMPLYLAACRMARAAALEDPRFPPIAEDELPDVEFEISVLSPMRLVDDPSAVRVGRDGLYIIHGSRSGVLLPQVPVELGWSRTQFLEGVCEKAGLSHDAYLDPETILYSFSAEVFGPSGEQ